MKNKQLGMFVACLIPLSSLFMAEVSAEEKNESYDNMVCAVVNVVGCVDGGRCIQDTARNFDLPELIILDIEKKVIRASYESGHKAVSPIKNLEQSGNHLILQGVENSQGWNIAVEPSTGSMSGASVGEAISFLVFGTCTTL